MTGNGGREGHGETRATNRTSAVRPSSQVPTMRADRRPGAARSGRTGPARRDGGFLARPRTAPDRPCLSARPWRRRLLERFDAGCAALGLGDLPLGARDAILGHLRLLLAWTAAINLTAIRDPDAAVTGHLLDSLAAVPFLRAAGVRRFLDLGSGGGYPGLPLALALPAETALLVDSIAKKAAFLRVAVAAAGMADRVAVAAVRAEALAADRRHRERWPAVTVRAVAPLAELVELAFPLLVPGGLLLAWKRAGPDDEWDRAARRGGARRRSGGGIGVEIVPLPAPIRRPGGPRARRRPQGRAHGTGLAALAGGAEAPSVVTCRTRRAAPRYAPRRCVSRSSRTSMPTSRRSTRCSPRSATSTPSGSWATWSGTGPIPTRSWRACARSVRPACGATTTRPRWASWTWRGSTPPLAGRSSGRPGESHRRPGPGWPACRSEPSSAR